MWFKSVVSQQLLKIKNGMQMCYYYVSQFYFNDELFIA